MAIDFLLEEKEILVLDKVVSIKRLGLGLLFRLLELIYYYSYELLMNNTHKIAMLDRQLLILVNAFISPRVAKANKSLNILVKEIFSFNIGVNKGREGEAPNNNSFEEKMKELNKSFEYLICYLSFKMNREPAYIIENINYIQAITLIEHYRKFRIENIIDERYATQAKGEDLDKHIRTLKGFAEYSISELAATPKTGAL